MKKTFSKGGIHPVAKKTASAAIRLLPLPQIAMLPLQQHIGAPARATVNRGDHVVRGQMVAESISAVSASVHTPVSGTVTSIENIMTPCGTPLEAIIVTASEEEHEADSETRRLEWEQTLVAKTDLSPAKNITPEEILLHAVKAGIVGLGGATFPAHAKLCVQPGNKIDTLIINGCECEPYLMCDDALMRNCAPRIVEGAALMLKATGASRAIIAVEDNKTDAIATMSTAIAEAGNADISLEVMRTKYPQGGEKQLIEACTGRRVGSGALPASVGVIVHNVATAFALRQAVTAGQPLIERVVTVSGDIPVDERRNYLAAIGTPLSALPLTMPAGNDIHIIAGGPMMGRGAVNLDAPLTKGCCGLTILSGTRRRPTQPCVRCGACVEACPMGLEPYLLSAYGSRQLWSEAAAASVADCLECGACSYSCPSSRPLLDFIRIAKQRARTIKQD